MDKTIYSDVMVTEEFSWFFENTIKSLNISPRNLTLGDTTNLSNPVEIAIKASIDDILKEMKSLDNKKNGTFNNTLSNCMKEVSKVTAPCLTNIWNTQIINGQTFPDNLKLADITIVFKK